MRVKEIMIKEVASIPPQLSVREALELLRKKRISGLPVIDDKNKLVGMFTEKEVLYHILPSYVEKVGRFIYEENPKSIKKKLQELGKIQVSSIMRKDVVTATEDTTLCEVARVMLTQKVRRIPVLDKTGQVVGILARGDVLNAFTKEAEIEK